MTCWVLLACAVSKGRGAVESGGEAGEDDGAAETGDTDAAGETGETGGDTTATVAPELVEGRWRFQAGGLTLAVDAERGARIASFALSGVELLTDAATDPDNWGATFWTSPQRVWTWPPPPALDAEPWTARVDGTALVLRSGPAVVGDATFEAEKRVTVGDVATVTHTLRNVGTEAVEVAGWQVTRVPPEGLTVWPSGAYVNPTSGALAYTEAGGHVWVAEAPSADAKLLADGAGGWIAHVAGGVALVQRFPDAPLGDAAPGEAEVEIFANGGGGYREVEVQSAYVLLAPGEALTWTVTWSARAVPPDVTVAVGSDTLLAWLAEGAR